MVKIKKVKISEIRPYWRNPRINSEAIEKVKQSIQKYGYNQYIVVDKNNIIVVGHTRYFALKKLGIEEINVFETDLDEKKCREYRIVDNKTNEYSSWDFDKLEAELRTLTIEEIKPFFTNDEELIKKITNIEIKSSSNVDFSDITKEIDKKQRLIEVSCVNCGGKFFVDLDELENKYYGGY